MSPCVGRTLYKTYKCAGRACEPFNERRLQQIYNWIHVRRVKYCLASLHSFETYFQNDSVIGHAVLKSHNDLCESDQNLITYAPIWFVWSGRSIRVVTVVADA